MARLLEKLCESLKSTGCYNQAVPTVNRVAEKIGRIVGQPDLARVVLPDQRPHRQVDGQCRVGLHSGRPGARVPENDHRSRTEMQPGLFSGGCVVDFTKHHPPLAAHSVFEAPNRISHAMLALNVNKSRLRCVLPRSEGAAKKANRNKERYGDDPETRMMGDDTFTANHF